MKRWLALFWAVIMLVLLAGCTQTATIPPATTDTQETAAPQIEPNKDDIPQEEPVEEQVPVQNEYPKLSGEVGVYKAGVYEVTVRGMGGNIVFHITFGPDSLTDIEAVKHHETAGLGDRALENLVPAIIEAQNTQVDGWSGATITSDAIKEAVNIAIEEAKG